MICNKRTPFDMFNRYKRDYLPKTNVCYTLSCQNKPISKLQMLNAYLWAISCNCLHDYIL